MSDRSLIEIFLELENKLDKVLSYVSNMDQNYKLILHELKELKKLPISKVSPVSVTEETKPRIPSVEPIETKKTNKSPNLKQKIAPFVETKKDKSEEGTAKMVSVQQKIAYSDGEPVRMAKIRIRDVDGKLAREIMTNNLGKWHAMLLPGEYYLTAFKGAFPETKKPVVDYKTNFTISETDKIELDELCK